MAFRNRSEAGRLLAERLEHYRHRHDVVVLALPRSGVPVAYEVAMALDAPLDVCLVRKIALPGHEQLSLGAIAGGVRVLNQHLVQQLQVSSHTVEQLARIEEEELRRREQAYRVDRPPIDLKDKIVIVIDDGLTSGTTMRAALEAVRQRHPARLVAATPIGARAICRELRQSADEVVCAITPEDFFSVGTWYEDFHPTTDSEVTALLQHAADRDLGSSPIFADAAVGRPTNVQSVQIAARGDTLEGTLTLPTGAHGLVLFAHGSGSSRHSPRNRFMAEALHRLNLGTLLFDLLTVDEERLDARTGHLRFDIKLLTRRLTHAVDWVAEHESTRHLPLGLFGASTGAAAALQVAAQRPQVAAVVSRGGRPDLASDSLDQVRAAVLFVVGAHDDEVLELNRYAFARLTRAHDRKLTIVPRATHLFEEPGTLTEAAHAAGGWFDHFLVRAATAGVH